MKKWTIVLALAVILLTGCSASWSHSYGTLVISTSTSKSWDIRWETMEGEKNHELFYRGEEKLVYSMEAEAQEIKVTLKQDELEKELPLDETAFSLADFHEGKIQIIVEVTGGKKSKLHFELQ